MRPAIQVLYLLLSALFGAIALQARAAADSSGIIDTAGVEAAIQRGALVWDVRTEEEYRKGHIPGAVNIDDVFAQLREPKSEDYLPVPQLEQILGEAGIDPQREMVVYGSKASTGAYFGMITMQWLGGQKVSAYHGGIDDWKAANKTTATEATRLPAVKLKLQPQQSMIVSTKDVLAKLGNSDVQIVDARTEKEFNGDDIRALRGGHIPGATNIPYETNWIDPDTPRKLQRKQVNNKDGFNLKSDGELRALYAKLNPEKETIVYCQSGARASNTAAVLQKLGFKNVKVYDASWLGYGNQMDAPAENVSYFNVARVQNMLNMLQGRIDELEAQLTEMKGQQTKGQQTKQ